MRRRRTVAAVAGALLVAALTAAGLVARTGEQVEVTETPLRVEVGPEPDGTAVALDVSVHTAGTAGVTRPAVLLAHGFGGSKASTAEDAARLARAGYLVLTWSARGFGASDGQVHLDDPDYEVADAQRLVDLLAERSDVARDADGDPRVGVSGGSYGGALALMLAGVDDRVDAVAASITWHDLSQSLVPQHAVATAPGAGPPTPAAVDPVAEPGVFAEQWAARFFSVALATAGRDAAGAAGAGSGGGGSGDTGEDAAGAPPGDAAGGGPTADAAGTGAATSGSPAGPGGAPDPGLTTDPAVTPCGSFAADVCAAYTRLATRGVPDAETLALLRRHSPAPLLSAVRAPVLLMPGQSDSLFPLSQADASARALAEAGVPVRTLWLRGGHDGGVVDVERAREATLDWFARWLPVAGGDGEPTGPRGDAPGSPAGFSWAAPRRAGDGGPVVRRSGGYPGLGRQPAAPSARVALQGPATTIVSPPGGRPAAVTGVPGVSGEATDGLGDVAGERLAVLPGQSAVFTTGQLEQPLALLGAPRVSLRVSSSAPEATLFAALYDVDPAGGADLPGRLVAPVRLTGLTPGASRAVDVSLPAVVRDVPAGHRLRLVVATTDAAYAVPDAPRVDRVALAADPLLVLPLAPLDAEDAAGSTGVPPGLVAAVAVLLLAAAGTALTARVRGRRRDARAAADAGATPAAPAAPPAPVTAATGSAPDTRDAGGSAAGAEGGSARPGTPLVVTGLTKVYPGGLRAVDDVSFTVAPGQVVGLLGPNGAGKTTALRMLMGLVHPTAGSISVLGSPVRPGAPVLQRVGAFVEGPGFLPHRTGMQNLALYWQATGRPADQAGTERALQVAGLGDAVHRPVRSYSHGMRQRLGIAQAMLGTPDLLVLDEPTNGLDPPQIRAMRDVLRRYATGGRSVLVSSHLLAEVEQTCSHVVVMDRGRVVAQGRVADLVAGGGRLRLDVDAPEVALSTLSGDGLVDVRTDPDAAGTLLVDAGDVPPQEVVRRLVRAGVGVQRVVPQRRLEEVFLDLVQRGAG